MVDGIALLLLFCVVHYVVGIAERNAIIANFISHSIASLFCTFVVLVVFSVLG